MNKFQNKLAQNNNNNKIYQDVVCTWKDYVHVCKRHKIAYRFITLYFFLLLSVLVNLIEIFRFVVIVAIGIAVVTIALVVDFKLTARYKCVR